MARKFCQTHCDSPGGEVAGCPECAAVIAEVVRAKPVVAVVNSLCASAAYWLASQATEVVCTPSGEVGSIGIFAVHADFSAADRKAGIKNTIISTPEFKAEGNDLEPLNDEGREYIAKVVSATYQMFLGDVARGRGTSSKRVEADYGKGRALMGKPAKVAGLVDRIGTLDAVLGEFAGQAEARRQAKARRAQLRAEWEQLRRRGAALRRSCLALGTDRARY